MTLQFFKAVLLLAGAAMASMALAPGAAADEPPPEIVLMPQDSNWILRLPQDEAVTFQGVVSFDGAGAGEGSMMYPGDAGLGGFLVAIFTHRALTESTKTSQKTKLQEEADKVLVPYRTVLDGYHHRELMQQALQKAALGGGGKLAEPAEQPGSAWFIQSVPVFSMTQDQSAIILDHAIAIYAPDAPSTAVYQNFIRVVSRVHSGKDLAGSWTAHQGKKLKEESVSLYAHSLDLALNEARNGPSKDSGIGKTFRYPEGGVERIERALLVSEQCNRLVIRTLRGWLMSVPKKDAPAKPAAGCK
jgi:hypothetical protein